MAVCSLVVFHFFRRILRQEGAFLHQTRGERRSPIWWCRRVCHEVTLNAHVQLQLQLEVQTKSESGCTANETGIVLERFTCQLSYAPSLLCRPLKPIPQVTRLPGYV